MTSMQSARAAVLHPEEVDLLCAFAGVGAPFPVRIRSRGATEEERRAGFGQARARLQSRGLAGHGGPLGVAADFVHLLRQGGGALDLVVTRRGKASGAVVLAHRDSAVLVEQDMDRTNGAVRLLGLGVRDAVDGLLRLVPDHPAPRAAPFSVARSALDRLHQAIVSSPGTLGPDDLDRLRAAHGIDDQTARRMVSHLQPVLGNGQTGAAVRRGTGWVRGGEELRWLDSARGRFRLGTGEWMSVNPIGPDELRAEVRAMAGQLW
ncbi:ESX secretion-associated protein EspG [Actinokineospora guangxiensis]|uniref:ESX secretion-associated protein EspG n=1 Tax=Actinokineospora guangxiensis TaxID=1490288 RepID=A0ABW0EIV2_9PSEU